MKNTMDKQKQQQEKKKKEKMGMRTKMKNEEQNYKVVSGIAFCVHSVSFTFANFYEH